MKDRKAPSGVKPDPQSSGAFFDAVREIAAVMFAGLGVMAGAVSLGALTALVTVGLVNALVWYGRLHLKLLKPALEAGEART